MDQPQQAPDKGAQEKTGGGVRRGPRRWPIWVALVAVLAVVGAFWWNRSQTGQPSQTRATPPAMSVVVAAVETGTIDISLDALGTVTSLATVTVRTQISGQLTLVAFTEGQEVKQGDLLAEVDCRPYDAALAQAQGQLARDQALLKGAQVDLTRYQGLAAKNAVAHQTLDTQVALVAQYQGTVAADEAQVQAASVNVQYCRILSPVDGRAGLRQVDEGNYVTPGDATGIVVITQIKPISVLFTVPEDQLLAISTRLRAGAVLTVGAYDRNSVNKLDDGTLQTFDSQIDPTTGTIKLRALFANAASNLYPNQFVNVRLLVDQHKDVAVVPVAAVLRGTPGTYVYLLNPDNTVAVRPITLGATQDESVEVTAGLKAGDQVVVDGADKLRDGAAVTVRPQLPAAGASPAATPGAATPAPAAAATAPAHQHTERKAKPPQPASGSAQ